MSPWQEHSVNSKHSTVETSLDRRWAPLWWAVRPSQRGAGARPALGRVDDMYAVRARTITTYCTRCRFHVGRHVTLKGDLWKAPLSLDYWAWVDWLWFWACCEPRPSARRRSKHGASALASSVRPVTPYTFHLGRALIRPAKDAKCAVGTVIG